MSMSRTRLRWVVLVAVGLMSASGTRSIAAEPVKPKLLAPAYAPAARPEPAKKRSTLLGTMADALAEPAKAKPPAAADPFAAQPPAPVKAPAAVARPAAAARAEPAQKRTTLLGALANALGGGEARDLRRMDAVRANEAVVRQLEAQMLPQFRQLLCVELAHLRRVCPMDAKSLAEIAKATKPGFADMVHKSAVSRYTGRRGSYLDAPDAMDPLSQVQNFLAPLAEAKLGQKQARIYRQESEKRAQCRKRAVVLNLVAAMDEHLVLTAEQREKLVQSLSANYQHGWEQFLRVFSYNAQYLPGIRDDLVVPLLDEKQKDVWRQVPKVGASSFWGLHVVHQDGTSAAEEIQEIARIVQEAHNEK